jgi:hypothetical protein
MTPTSATYGNNKRSERGKHRSSIASIEEGNFGKHDLWDLWLLDKAEDVPCGSIHTFLHYLCSESTKQCEILHISTLAMGSVEIVLTGPLADDERNHLLRYQLNGGNVGRLKEAEKDLLVSRLVEHYSIEDGKSFKKVDLACRAVGVSFPQGTPYFS